MVAVDSDDLLLMSTPTRPVKEAAESTSSSSEPSTAVDNSSLDKILDCTPSDSVSTVCRDENFPHFFLCVLNRGYM